MTDSEIIYSKHSTTFVGPDASAFFRASVLASALKLYAETRIRPSRHMTPTMMLAEATKLTGKTYKPRTGCAEAAEDVRRWAREMKAALPQTVAD